MNSTSALSAGLTTEEQVFRNFLNSYAIIDIGTIETVTENRATVATSIFVQGKQVIYPDVEIIYPGNNQGVFGAASAGCACLIFIPRSCMPNVTNKNVKHGEMAYSKNGIKVMPIGNGSSNNVRAYFDGTGNLNIFTDNYSLIFQDMNVTIQKRDATFAMTMDGTGNFYITKQGNDSTHRVSMEDGTSQSVWISKNKDVQWTDTLNSDGSRTLVQNNPQNEEADPTCSITIDKDGNVSVNGKTINLNGDDKKLVTYGELNEAMQKLWTAMTTTPIAGNGSTQPAWTGLPNGIDISASETSTIKTGG